MSVENAGLKICLFGDLEPHDRSDMFSSVWTEVVPEGAQQINHKFHRALGQLQGTWWNMVPLLYVKAKLPSSSTCQIRWPRVNYWVGKTENNMSNVISTAKCSSLVRHLAWGLYATNNTQGPGHMWGLLLIKLYLSTITNMFLRKYIVPLRLPAPAAAKRHHKGGFSCRAAFWPTIF